MGHVTHRDSRKRSPIESTDINRRTEIYMPITININGRARTTNAAPGTALLYVLRNDF